MTLETFYKHFELLADAPNAVPKLREMVLQLAVRGNLVEQRPGEVAPRKQMSEVQALLPFSVPNSWAWRKLGDTLNLINGRAFKPTEWSASGLPIIRIQNLNNPSAPFNFCDLAVDKKFHVEDDDFLISWSGTPGTSFGAFIWSRGHALLNQHIFRAEFLTDNFDKVFLKNLINVRMVEMIAQARGGVGLKHVTKGQLESLNLPLPPLEEQKRIVAKVDELMALCDDLEQQQRAKSESRSRLNTAFLTGLSSAPDETSFKRAWERVASGFDMLYSTPETIGDLRKTILQLAVQGKLMRQDPNDEPAEKLLEEIVALRSMKSRARKIDYSTATSSQGISKDLPPGWIKVKLTQIGDVGTGSTPATTNFEYYEKGTIPWITSSLTGKPFVSAPEKYITEKARVECRLRIYPVGTLVIALYGQGKTRGQVTELHIDATINQACAAVTFVTSVETLRPFVKLVLQKQYTELRALAAGGAQPNLNVAKIKDIELSLPPTQEQKRIVAKVDVLMTLVDKLETSLQKAQADAERLLEAVISSLLLPEPKQVIEA